MFKITIQSKIHGERWLNKDTQAEVDAYIQWCHDTEHWGKNSHIVPAQLDEQGNVVTEEYVIPAEYFITVENIADQVRQDQINKESLEFLASTDWMILRHLRQKALSQKTSLTEAEYLQLEQERANVASRVVKS